jgi:hypothetical protein
MVIDDGNDKCDFTLPDPARRLHAAASRECLALQRVAWVGLGQRHVTADAITREHHDVARQYAPAGRRGNQLDQAL